MDQNSGKISAYLQSLRDTFPTYTLSAEDKATIKFEGLQRFLYNKITSRKFRRSSISELLHNTIVKAIAQRIETKRPITFTFPTGGFKKRQFATAPYVDWSEFFAIRFLEEIAAPIAVAYEPGVRIEFVSNEVDMELLGNYTREELLAYTDSFNELLATFNPSLPKNVTMIYREMREQFAPGEYQECLNLAKPDLDQLYREFDAKTAEQQEYTIKKAERNYKFSEKEELLSPKEKRDILLNRALLHDMYVRPIWLSFLAKKKYIRNDFEIAISTFRCDWGIHYGTCSASPVQFWVGTGVLQQRNVLGNAKKSEFIPQIYSIEQFKVRDTLLQTIPVKDFVGKNFASILLEK